MARRRRSQDVAEHVAALFDQEVRQREGTFTAVGDLLFLTVLPSTQTVLVSLSNLTREAERDRLDDPAVRERLQLLIASGVRDRGPDGWPKVRPELRWALEPVTLDIPAAYGVRLSPQVQRLLVRVDRDESLVRYVQRPETEAWNQEQAAIDTVAATNLDAILAAATLNVEQVDGRALGWLDTPTVSKASLVLAPSLKAVTAESLGWPLLAVAPARDFLYLFDETAIDTLLPRLAPVVAREFASSPYPISSEVLRIADDGIAAIGVLAPDPQQPRER